MTMSITTHWATGISFRTHTHIQHEGGWLQVTVRHGESVLDEDDIFIHAPDNVVFDHFRDIERLTNGAIGSLRAEPTKATSEEGTSPNVLPK